MSALFTCECGRCGGHGRYDRGTCFDCKGNGYRNKPRKPSKSAVLVHVTFSNGSKNTAKIYASSSALAVAIVERQIALKGWTATAIAA